MKSLHVFIKKSNPLLLFYILLAVALLSRIVCDYNLNRIGIHEGNIFPLRKFSTNPPYPVAILYLEWMLIFAGSLLILGKKIRWGALLCLIGLLMGLSQMFQNQKTLLALVALTLFIEPIRNEKNHSLRFLKAQLIILYLLAAFHKISDGFVDGLALKNTLDYMYNIEQNVMLKSFLHFFATNTFASLFSIATVIIQLLIPLCLIKKPKLGFSLVLFLNAGFLLFLRDIFPFAVISVALSTLFLIDQNNQAGNEVLPLGKSIS